MLNYLKKNIPLLIFVGLTVVVALVMTVLDIQKYIGYREAQRLIGVYTEEIRANVAKTPSHNKKNLDAINEDKAKLAELLYDAQCRYGKIHRAKLIEFAKAIGTTESALLNDFKNYHNGLKEKAKTSGENDKDIYDGFVQTLFTVDKKIDLQKKAKVEAALAVFTTYASEYIHFRGESAYKCFLEALGLPVTGTLSTMNNVLFHMNETELGEMIPGFDPKEFDNDKRRDVLENFYVSPIKVNVDQFELAYRQFAIKSDLYKKMTASGITKVISLKNIPPPVSDKQKNPAGPVANSDLEGKLDGKYMVYTYEIALTGSMNSIRKLLDSLSNAHKENRIYNVRDIQLERLFEAESKENIKKSFENKETVKFDKDGNVSEAYGKILVGKDQDVTCNLKIDYIMYIDDMIKRTPSTAEKK